MEPKKLAMIFAIAILLPLCIGLFVDALYADQNMKTIVMILFIQNINSQLQM